VVELGGEKYHVTPASLGANVIIDAPPARVKVPETVCLVPEVAALNLSVLPLVISVRLTHCSWSINVTIVGLVIVMELKDLPADVTD
jgi:hypothetical protein